MATIEAAGLAPLRLRPAARPPRARRPERPRHDAGAVGGQLDPSAPNPVGRVPAPRLPAPPGRPAQPRRRHRQPDQPGRRRRRGRGSLRRPGGGDPLRHARLRPGPGGAGAWPAESHPGTVGMVLLNHGLFTFGDDSATAYRRHVELIARGRGLARRDRRPRRAERRERPRRPCLAVEELAESAAARCPRSPAGRCRAARPHRARPLRALRRRCRRPRHPRPADTRPRDPHQAGPAGRSRRRRVRRRLPGLRRRATRPGPHGDHAARPAPGSSSTPSWGVLTAGRTIGDAPHRGRHLPTTRSPSSSGPRTTSAATWPCRTATCSTSSTGTSSRPSWPRRRRRRFPGGRAGHRRGLGHRTGPARRALLPAGRRRRARPGRRRWSTRSPGRPGSASTADVTDAEAQRRRAPAGVEAFGGLDLRWSRRGLRSRRHRSPSSTRRVAPGAGGEPRRHVGPLLADLHPLLAGRRSAAGWWSSARRTCPPPGRAPPPTRPPRRRSPRCAGGGARVGGRRHPGQRGPPRCGLRHRPVDRGAAGRAGRPLRPDGRGVQAPEPAGR